MTKRKQPSAEAMRMAEELIRKMDEATRQRYRGRYEEFFRQRSRPRYECRGCHHPFLAHQLDGKTKKCEACWIKTELKLTATLT